MSQPHMITQIYSDVNAENIMFQILLLWCPPCCHIRATFYTSYQRVVGQSKVSQSNLTDAQAEKSLIRKTSLAQSYFTN